MFYHSQTFLEYRKDPKFSDRQALANSADQTAPRSGSTLFAIPYAPLWTNFLMDRPLYLNLRVITGNISGVRKLIIFMVA